MKRVAKPKHDAVGKIPLIVGIRPIRVEPPLAIVVALDVEHIRVAIGVGLMCIISSESPPFECPMTILKLN